jgi:hypothetical protein
MNVSEYLTWLQSVTSEAEFDAFAGYVRENLTTIEKTESISTIRIVAHTVPPLLLGTDADAKLFEQAIMMVDLKIMLSNRLPSSVFLNIPDRSPTARLLTLMCKYLHRIYSMKKIFIYGFSSILKIVRSFKNDFKI